MNAKRKTTEQFKKQVYDLVGEEYSVLGEYETNANRILIRHNTCGNQWDGFPNSFLQGQRCPICRGLKNSKETKRKPSFKTKMFKQEVLELVKDEYEVLGEYKGSSAKILMKHLLCNREYYITPNEFLNQNSRCPFCAIRNKYSHEKFLTKVSNIVSDEYSVLGEYIRSTEKILLKHNNCNTEFEMVPANFLHGQRCPKCQAKKAGRKPKSK